MWTKLNQGWFIRLISNGFELYSFEKNFEVKIEDTECLKILISIVCGEKEISSKDRKIKKILTDFEKKNILSFVNSPPSLMEKSKPGKALNSLTKKTMGNQSIINDIYWADPRNSRYCPSANIFTAEYVENDTKEKAWSFGFDQSKEIAEIKTIVEAIERYISGIVPWAETINCTAIKLGDLAINPNDILPCQKKRKEIVPFSKTKKYFWKDVKILPDDKKAYLPIECIYYPINKKIIPKPCMLTNSSGVASNFYFNEALLGAIYEYIERDAFMMTWLNRITMPQIEKSCLSKDIKTRISRIENIGYKVYFVDITIDIAPVVLVVFVNHSKAPSLIIGISSNLNILKACHKALLEAEQQLYWALRKDGPQYQIPKKQKYVKTILDHSTFYRPPNRLKYASFLWSGKIKKKIDRDSYQSNELKTIIEKIDSIGMKVVVADLSPQSLPYDIYTVRAIIPGLIPIYFGYKNEPMNLNRLKMMTNKWLDCEPYIHPFS